jgi:hypothetical protein
MYYPFHIDTKLHHVGLFQLDDERFQMIKQGRLSPLMVGFEYVIVENRLADFLKLLEINSTKFKNAIIWNRGKNIEYKNYTQLVLENHFSHDQIGQLDMSGLNMFVMDNNSLFVTPSLKKILSKSAFKYLRFSEGLGFFGQ